MTERARTAVGWAATVLIACLPGLIGLDSGGVYPWSFWALAVAALVGLVASLAVYRDGMLPRRGFTQGFTIGLLVVGLYALFQTLPLPAFLQSLLAPGSASAWTDWMPAGVPAEDRLGDDSWGPISVSPHRTQTTAAIVCVLAMLAWCGATLFSSRDRLLWLLSALAIAGAFHALLGLWQLFIAPHQTFWGVPNGGAFGVFVNRNNAATLLNISLAASCGLIGWRLAAVTGREFGEHDFSIAALLDLVSDRISVLAALAIGFNITGLIACGSRGGLAGAIVGVALAVGLIRSRQVAHRIVAAIGVLVAVGLVLLVRFDVSPRSLERFGASAYGASESVVDDERFEHWQDGLQALTAYLPSGSGLGTYRFAHLPFQTSEIDGWFVNADNLWLEWLVEGGLVALIVLLAVAALMIVALLRLRDTVDPLDHGMASAGWCLFGSLLFTQAFDFGLLLAGSASGTVILMAAIFARSETHGTPLRKTPPATARIQFAKQSPAWRILTLVAVLSVFGVVSVVRLQNQAIADAAIRLAVLADAASSAETTAATERLEKAAEVVPRSAELHYQLANAYLRQADQQVFATLNQYPQWTAGKQTTVNDLHWNLIRARARYLATDEQGLEAQAKQVIDEALGSADESIRRARQQALRAVGLSPLMPEPRFLLLRLGIVLDASEDRVELTEQLLVLRPFADRSLEALAESAALADDWQTAGDAWRRIISRNPKQVVATMDLARSLGHPDPYQLLPHAELAYRYAALNELRNDPPNGEFLREALRVLQEQYPEDRQLRARRYVLLARIQLALRDLARAEEFYDKAVTSDPVNIELQLEVAYFLANRDRLTEAEQRLKDLQAKLGVPDDRIERALRKIEERRAELRFRAPSIPRGLSSGPTEL